MQLNDIRALLKDEDDLDFEYMRRWADDLSVGSLPEEVQS